MKRGFLFVFLRTDDNKDVAVYVKASMVDIKTVIDPLVGGKTIIVQEAHSTKMSFELDNGDYVAREIVRLV